VGFAAHEGTLAHALCEAAMTIKGANRVPWKTGMSFTVEGEAIVVTQDMLDAVKVFVTTAVALSDFADWRMVEGEVSLSWLWEGSEPPEDVFGTLDFATCDGVTLYIVDFKYGAGRTVTVKNNTQLLCYALGALGKLKRERPDLFATLENVCLAIVQPRAGGLPVRQWTISVSDLIYWGYAVLKPSIDAIWSGEPLPLVAGNHCFFCAAAMGCPAYKRMRLQKSIDSFPDYDPALSDLDFVEEMI
jgi:hypothetical protein